MYIIKHWKGNDEGNINSATYMISNNNIFHLTSQNSNTGTDADLVKKEDSDTSGNSVIDNHSQNLDTFYQNIDYDSNENPFVSYDSRGYQRGETYRFAITIFDKNNRVIRTKFVGDIKMPEHWENQYTFFNNKDLSREYDGSPGVGFTGMELYDSANYMLDQNIYCEDFRISYIKGIRNPYNDYTEGLNGSTNRHYGGGGGNARHGAKPRTYPYENVHTAERTNPAPACSSETVPECSSCHTHCVSNP